MKKKLLTLLLAVLLIAGLWVPAAADDAALEGASAGFGSEGYIKNGRQTRGFIEDLSWMSSTRAGDELFFPLYSWYFTWTKGANRPIGAITPQQDKTIGFGLSVAYLQGEEAFERITVTTRDNQMGILVDFVDSYPNFEPTEFEVECWLTAGGGQIDGCDFTIAGELRNRERYVVSAAGVVPLGVGRQAVGYHMQDLKDVSFDLGCGVTLTADLLIAQKVYAAAFDKPSPQDKDMLAANPGISRVIRIDQLGFTGGRVQIDTGEDGVMHAYDVMRGYLGTTDSPLRLERVYYLSKTKLG